MFQFDWLIKLFGPMGWIRLLNLMVCIKFFISMGFITMVIDVYYSNCSHHLLASGLFGLATSTNIQHTSEQIIVFINLENLI